MKFCVALIVAIVLSSCTASWPLWKKEQVPSPSGPAAFERLKSLAGTWESVPCKGAKKSKVQYRVTSGGRAVEEVIFAGTPHEMMSIYFLDGQTLRMTHYCSLGNRPDLVMLDRKDERLHFELSEDSPINVNRDHHIHELSLRIEGPKRLKQEWVGYSNGHRDSVLVLDLVRKSGPPKAQ